MNSRSISRVHSSETTAVSNLTDSRSIFRTFAKTFSRINTSGRTQETVAFSSSPVTC